MSETHLLDLTETQMTEILDDKQEVDAVMQKQKPTPTPMSERSSQGTQETTQQLLTTSISSSVSSPAHSTTQEGKIKKDINNSSSSTSTMKEPASLPHVRTKKKPSTTASASSKKSVNNRLSQVQRSSTIPTSSSPTPINAALHNLQETSGSSTITTPDPQSLNVNSLSLSVKDAAAPTAVFEMSFIKDKDQNSKKGMSRLERMRFRKRIVHSIRGKGKSYEVVDIKQPKGV